MKPIDNKKVEGRKLRKKNLKLLVLLLIPTIIAAGIGGWVLWSLRQEKKPDWEKPIVADTVKYTVSTYGDISHFDSDGKDTWEPGKPQFRSADELVAETETRVVVATDKAPYAFTGCYGDFQFGYSDTTLPRIVEVRISSYPNVLVDYERNRVNTDDLMVFTGEDKVLGVPKVSNFVFQDLNGDRLPELIVEASGLMLNARTKAYFFVYDFVDHKSYEYGFFDDSASLCCDFDSVSISRPDGTFGEFLLRFRELLYIADSTDTDVFDQAQKASDDPAEPFCWFDYDNGDEAKRRVLRLPEYPDRVFVAEKTRIVQYFTNGEEKNIVEAAPVSAYFADLDGDGKRELYSVMTMDHAWRNLNRYTMYERAPGERGFIVSTLFGDRDTVGSQIVCDTYYYSYVRLVLSGKKLSVKMKDPGSRKGTEISTKIIDCGTVHQFSGKNDSVYWSEDTILLPKYRLLRIADAGEAFRYDRQSLVVLKNLPNQTFNPNDAVFYGENNSEVSSRMSLVEDSYDIFRTVFADLNGDGTQEICVNDWFVFDAATGNEIARLDRDKRFFWYNDELWVAMRREGVSVLQPGDILGKPVLRNGQIVVVAAE